jgi:two-component system, OmpR family, phosphate regulon response regulator PhoB
MERGQLRAEVIGVEHGSDPFEGGGGVVAFRLVRSVVYRFEDLAALRSAVAGAEQELELPGPDLIHDGEWLLATFEVGEGRRATAAAARGEVRGGRRFLVFEQRDWERLRAFVTGAPPGGFPPPSAIPTMPDVEPPTERPVESEALAIPLVREASSERPPPSSMPADLMAADTLRPPPPPGGAVHVPTSQGARVLVVDDDPDVCDVVATMLEAVGLTVESATSAEQALELVHASAFDLVVLDWTLPGMSGLDLCKRIRHEAAIASLPVLFLSGHSSTTDIVAAFASGADDFVVKPFRAPELGARIFALLRRARMSAL